MKSANFQDLLKKEFGILKSGLIPLLVAIISISLSIIGFYFFFQCDYIVYGWMGWEYWTSSGGYTVAQFISLCAGVYLFAYGVVFLMLFVIQSFNNIPTIHWSKFTFYFIALLILLGVTAGGLYYGVNLLYCILYFCIGTSSLSTTMQTAEIFAGTVYFFVGIFFSVILLILLIVNYQHRLLILELQSTSEGDSRETDSLLRSSRKLQLNNPPFVPGTSHTVALRGLKSHESTKNAWILVFVFGLFFPFFVLACCLLPTWWNSFAAASIQAYQASVPTESSNTYWYAVSGSVVFKLFPDIVIFYGTIYLVVIVALVAQIWSPLRNFFHLRSWIFGGVCVGQLLFWFIILCLMVGEFNYWYFDHLWEGISNSYFLNAERAARSMGQLANASLGLLVLPVTRNSVWSIVFGLSRESLLLYHQWLGYLMLLEVAAHMFLWWAVYAENDVFPSSIFSIPIGIYSDDFTVPLATLTFFIMLIVFGVFSLDLVRRRNYELFYYTHLFFMVVFFVVLWHATMSWYYIVPGLVLWVLDWCIRLNLNFSQPVRVTQLRVVVPPTSEIQTAEGMKPTGAVVELSYLVTSPVDSTLPTSAKQSEKSNPLSHQMGQFVYINIPAISALDWHPFTISSAPCDSETSHLIRQMGPGSEQWTGRLLDLASGADGKAFDPCSLHVNIEGPYGTALDVENYSHVLMVGGGIGVTPLHSHFRHLVNSFSCLGQDCPYSHLKSVKLVWIVRTLKEAESLYSPLFSFVHASPPSLKGVFSVQVFVTSKRPNDPPPRSPYISYGRRPDLSKIVEDLSNQCLSDLQPKQESSKASGVVYVCGPNTLSEELSVRTQPLSSHIHIKLDVFEM